MRSWPWRGVRERNRSDGGAGTHGRTIENDGFPFENFRNPMTRLRSILVFSSFSYEIVHWIHVQCQPSQHRLRCQTHMHQRERHCQQRGHANVVQDVGVLSSLPSARQHVSTVDGSSSSSSRQRFPPSPSSGGLGRQNKRRGGWRFARRMARGRGAEGACRSHRGRAGHRNAARRGGRGQGA